MSPSSHGVVLLMEDDANDAFLMQRAFRKANFQHPLRVVSDGDDAVDYIAGRGRYADRAAHPVPILLLLDLKLRRRSGMEVLTWLRAQPGLRRLPVVVLTATGDPADVNRAYDLGANSFLVKPLGLDALSRLVTALGDWWLARCESAEVRVDAPVRELSWASRP